MLLHNPLNLGNLLARPSLYSQPFWLAFQLPTLTGFHAIANGMNTSVIHVLLTALDLDLGNRDGLNFAHGWERHGILRWYCRLINEAFQSVYDLPKLISQLTLQPVWDMAKEKSDSDVMSLFWIQGVSE